MIWKYVFLYIWHFPIVHGEEIKTFQSTSQEGWVEILNSSVKSLDIFSCCFRFYQDYFDVPGMDTDIFQKYYSLN